MPINTLDYRNLEKQGLKKCLEPYKIVVFDINEFISV